MVSRVQLVMCKEGKPRLRPFGQRAKIATKRALFLDLRDEGGVARSEAGRAAQKQCAGRTDTRLASKAGGEARGERGKGRSTHTASTILPQSAGHGGISNTSCNGHFFNFEGVRSCLKKERW